MLGVSAPSIDTDKQESLGVGGVNSQIFPSSSRSVNAVLEEEIPSSQGRKAKELIDQPNTLSENQHNKSKPSHNHPIINQYDDIIDQSINTSQLHQSRLGLLSQALMMIITVGFLFSETLEEFWKTK